MRKDRGFLEDDEGWFIWLRVGTTRDLGHLWEEWLEGDTVQASSWEADAGVTISNPTIKDDVETFAVFSVDSAGTKVVRNTIRTTNGQLDEIREFRIIAYV